MTDNPGKTQRVLWGFAAVLYFVLVTVSHDWVSNMYSKVFMNFGRAAMESGVHYGFVALTVLLVGTCVAVWKTKGHKAGNVLSLWIGVGVLILAADKLLVVTNIERIHYPQYAILALLLVLAFSEQFFAVFLTTVAGMLDELVQFVWHPNYTKYVDFNDFALNALGALLGVTLFLTLFKKAPSETTGLGRTRTCAYVFTASMVILSGLLVWMGRIIPFLERGEDFEAFTRVGNRMVFVLSFVKHPGFWTMSEYGRRYHILSPLEGVVALAFLLALYRYLLRRC